MRIVHISAEDIGGGAAIACVRHAEAMLSAGLDTQVIVAKKNGRKLFVKEGITGIGPFVHSVQQKIHRRLVNAADPVGTFSLMAFGHRFHSLKEVREADVIFLHWVNGSTLSISEVEKILQLGKPVYWYMHDMFPITGGCHHSLKCKGFLSHCEDCPLVHNAFFRILVRKQFKSKLRHWTRYSNLSFVCPSQWLSALVKSSRISQGHDVFTIPNVIDTSFYKPLTGKYKELFGLEPSKRTILFGASSNNSVYKGFKDLYEFLKSLDPEKYEGLLIGEYDASLTTGISMKIRSTGYIYDDLSLIMAYNASDVFVISSAAENYPNVVLEAMSCGVPCVGYKVGGIPELIQDKISGYVTAENTPDELVRGIEYVFSDDTRYQELCKAARNQIEKGNSYKIVRSLYKGLL